MGFKVQDVGFTEWKGFQGVTTCQPGAEISDFDVLRVQASGSRDCEKIQGFEQVRLPGIISFKD